MNRGAFRFRRRRTLHCREVKGSNPAKRLVVAAMLVLAATTLAQTNDTFATATLLSASSGSHKISNATASKEPGEPDHAGDPGGHSIWYRWTATNAMPVTFETVGSSFDTLLAVYTGGNLSNLVVVAGNNDVFGSANRQSRVNFIPQGGTNYWIAVDGFNGATGNIYLAWIQRAGLPDLTVWGPAFNAFIGLYSFATNSCAVVEGLVQPGVRRLARFVTQSRNGGTADLHVGSPVGNPLFLYSACHGHYHFSRYVDHRLRDSNNAVAATGLKVGHCLTDTFAWDPAANPSGKYGCTDQGIQFGWADVYNSGLDGQWIDITGVPPGHYMLEVEINPDRILEESDYSNNVTQVPLLIPDETKPSLIYSSPSNAAAGVSPAVAALALIVDGTTTQLATNSVRLFYDDVLVAHTLTKNGITNRIAYSRAGLLEPLSAHATRLVFADNGDNVTYQTNLATFTIGAWSNIYLPSPLYLETFNALAEGALPPGWTVTNATTPQTAGISLSNPLSDAYKDFVVISSNRLFTVFGTRRLALPSIVVNGFVLPSLVSSNLAYADSDRRGDSPSSQVNVLVTTDYNLAGQSNIFVSFHSIYEQNQDNLGALEYSINGGTNWLPIVYMIDQDDILRDDGNAIDAVATLNTARSDQAYGLAYSAYVAAPVTADLAPFISGRVNDDMIESKRVELFRLPMADGQPRVRFRFAQTGTSSWYWGIDDFGIYSIVEPSPRITAVAKSGNNITIHWNGEVVSRLQKRTSLSNAAWQTVPDTLGLSSFTEPINAAETYYRLLKQ